MAYKRKFTKKTFKKRAAPKKTAMNKRIATVAKAAVMKVAETKRFATPAVFYDYSLQATNLNPVDSSSGTTKSTYCYAKAMYMAHTFDKIKQGVDMYTRVGTSIQPRGICVKYAVSGFSQMPQNLRIMVIKTALPNTFIQNDRFDFGYLNVFSEKEPGSPLIDRINTEKVKVLGSRIIPLNHIGTSGVVLNKVGKLYVPLRTSKINYSSDGVSYTLGNQAGTILVLATLDIQYNPGNSAPGSGSGSNPVLSFQSDLYFKDL